VNWCRLDRKDDCYDWFNYQNSSAGRLSKSLALKMADWPSIPGDPEIRVFNDHISEEDSLAKRLFPFDVLCIMRERTLLSGRCLTVCQILNLLHPQVHATPPSTGGGQKKRN